jgi:hypothetical protein
MRGQFVPDYAALHPGYSYLYSRTDFTRDDSAS